MIHLTTLYYIFTYFIYTTIQKFGVNKIFLFYFILSFSKDALNWSKVTFLIIQKISKINANGSEGSYDTKKIQFFHYMILKYIQTDNYFKL